MAPAEIVWNQATVDDWRRLIGRARGGTLLQSLAYAQAMATTERQLPHFGVIRADGADLGCILALERRAIAGLSRISLHRGPLWIDPPSEDRQREVLRLLRRKWPRRPWRRVSFLPEMPAGAASHRLLEESGYRRAGVGYRSILVDLGIDEPGRRQGLRATWRHDFQRAERADLSVEIDRHGKATLPWLIQHAEIDRKLRGYRGPSSKLSLQLMLAARVYEEALVLIASNGPRRIAGILVIRHGDTATYLIGWTGAEGRDLKATHLLLWRAMEALSADGVRWFDLGGINPEEAPGLTLFKRGLGGEEYELVGTYT